ncbi:MAG TPA: hypothetical protein PK950_03110 [Candidatus Paceibacterota bacterium]|nr:hypothetical protein [Candidatus Paceibacterota bacterium]
MSKNTIVVSGIFYHIMADGREISEQNGKIVGINENSRLTITASFENRIICGMEKEENSITVLQPEKWTDATINTKVNKPFALCVAGEGKMLMMQVAIMQDNEGFHLVEEVDAEFVLDEQNYIHGISNNTAIGRIKRYVCLFMKEFNFDFSSEKMNALLAKA